MRKRFSALLVAMLMLLSLVAVAGADEVIELRVLHYLDMTSPNSAEEGKIVWDAFQEAHPNIKLVIRERV